MISQTSEYALRAIVFLAADKDGSYTTEQISKLTKVPAPYLSKVLQSLAKAGLVQSQRGSGGGFKLTKPLGKLTVLDVVNAVDPIRRLKGCPLGLKAHGAALCPLHKRLDDAAASVEQAFANSKITELLSSPSTSAPLCEFPGGRKRKAGAR